MRTNLSCLRRVLTLSLALAAVLAFAGCGTNDTITTVTPGTDNGNADFSPASWLSATASQRAIRAARLQRSTSLTAFLR